MLWKVMVVLAVLWAASLILRLLTGMFFTLLLAAIAVFAVHHVWRRWSAS